jgi:hypothetical protein
MPANISGSFLDESHLQKEEYFREIVRVQSAFSGFFRNLIPYLVLFLALPATDQQASPR